MSSSSNVAAEVASKYPKSISLGLEAIMRAVVEEEDAIVFLCVAKEEANQERVASCTNCRRAEARRVVDNDRAVAVLVNGNKASRKIPKRPMLGGRRARCY